MDKKSVKDYESLTGGAGFVSLLDRCYLRLTGKDRQSFFHNFCTNEIKQLSPGQSCETFVLNAKGKILSFVQAICLENELLLTGHGPQSNTLLTHLDKYLIREDVEIADVTDEHVSLFVCGEQASSRLKSICPSLPARNTFKHANLEGLNCLIGNVEVAGFGYLLICDSADLPEIEAHLTTANIDKCLHDALEMVRVKNMTPRFGIDMDDSNLPQELQRDEQAINFNKGCYLGQETVARIDARGRVNNLLVGLKFSGSSPSRGDSLVHENKGVGRVTSVAELPTGERIGLGYVRREFREPGSEIGNAVVRNGENT